MDSSSDLVVMDVANFPEPPVFPGFIETPFSTKGKRFYYKDSKLDCQVDCGGHSIIEEVHWYNAATGRLELRTVKSLKVSLAATHPGGWEGFKADAVREVDAMLHLAGVPGVATCCDLIINNDEGIQIVMEKAPGVNLGVRMGCRHWRDLGLSWLEIQAVVKDIAQVLADCHARKLVHGDVKPQNIMTSADKTCVTLVDFGSASVGKGGRWEYQTGTIAYMAPEMLLAARSTPEKGAPTCFGSCSPANDCWALGLTALELLTRCSLFKLGHGKPSGTLPAEWTARQMQYTADLHKEWEDSSQSGHLHAVFKEITEQLAGASEDYKREGVSFLRSLLHPDPTERMTAKAALDHPFLTRTFSDVDPDSMPPEILEDDIELKTTLDHMLWAQCQKQFELWEEGEGAGEDVKLPDSPYAFYGGAALCRKGQIDVLRGSGTRQSFLAS